VVARLARSMARPSSGPAELRRSAGGEPGTTRLADGSEIHNSRYVEALGLAVPRDDRPTRAWIKVVAVPPEGWRRFFEYAALERETGFSRTGTTYSAVEVRYRLVAEAARPTPRHPVGGPDGVGSGSGWRSQ
jgi:hypothetical protein